MSTNGVGRFAKRLGTRLPGFLKPDKPTEALALLTIGAIIGGAGVTLVNGLTSQSPWNERADQTCLDSGNAYLNVRGDRLTEMRAKTRISAAALVQLEDLRSDVPSASILQFNTVLDDKQQVLGQLRREVQLVRLGRSTGAAELQREADYQAEQVDAQQLGLNVCGQGSGQQ